MKSLCVLVLALVVVVLPFPLLATSAEAVDKHSVTSTTTMFDNINVERILQNDRLVRNYVNCLLEQGRCTPEGRELRKRLPEALRSGCSDCSEKQRAMALTVVRHLVKHYPDLWRMLEHKYDPDAAFRQNYEHLLQPSLP